MQANVVAGHRSVVSVLLVPALALASALALWAPQAVTRVHAAGPTFPFQASTILTPPSVGPDYRLGGPIIGPNGLPWFTEAHGVPACNPEPPVTDPGCFYDGHFKGKVGHLNADGTFTEVVLPELFSNPSAITLGGDGNLWFIDTTPVTSTSGFFSDNSTIDRMTPSGELAQFTFQTPRNVGLGFWIPTSLTLGPDGNLYFVVDVGGGQPLYAELGQITQQGVISYIRLGQNNFATNLFGPNDIASVGGVLWFGGEQDSGCCVYRGYIAATINYFVPSTNVLGGYSFATGTAVGRLTAGPGDGNVWMQVAATNPSAGTGPASPIALVDGMGRVTSMPTQFFPMGSLVPGTDNRVYSTGGLSGCDGVSRVDETGATAEAIPTPGSSFSPRALDPATGLIWGLASACSGGAGATGIQSFKNLDAAGPPAPPLGPASAAFSTTQSVDPADGTGNGNVTVHLNACASTGAVAGYNWTVGSAALIPTSMCDFKTQIPVGDVSVTLGVSGVPGGPALSSVTQTVHTVPHASFSHLVDKTHVGLPTIRVLLNPCQSSGMDSVQWTVLDMTYVTNLSAAPLDPTISTCQYWFVDLNPGFPYRVTLTVTGPPSANAAQDSTASIVTEQMQLVFTFAMDQVTHDIQNTNIHFYACNSLGAAAYEWTVKTPSGSAVAHSASDVSCQRDVSVPLHVVPTDTRSPFAYYTLTLAATSGLDSGTTFQVVSMIQAQAPATSFEGCQQISIGPDACWRQLGGDIWSSLVGAKRPPDFLAFNIGVGTVSGGVVFACDGSTYVTAGLSTPTFRRVQALKDILDAAAHNLNVPSVGYGWVGNPEDGPPTNQQIDDFLGPGPASLQIGAAFPGFGMYFLWGTVNGSNAFGLMEITGLAIDLSAGIGVATNLNGPLVRGSTCSDGAMAELNRALLAGTALGQLDPLGNPQVTVNLATVTSPVTVAPNQTVGVLATGFTPATQFGASLHSDPIVLGIGTTDATGSLSFSFHVPGGLSPGTHRLVVTGWSQGQVHELAVTIIVATRTLSGSGTPVTAAEGSNFSGQVAGFTDTSATDAAGEFTASINWGDGSTSAGSVAGPAGGPFTVNGSHPYAEEASAAIATTITHTSGATATAQSTATITDPAVTATGGNQVTGTEGSDSGLQKVATFTDPAGVEPNPADPAGIHYAADIKWADGTSSVGVVSGPDAGGLFTVSGSHTYAEEGSYAVAVTIHHEGAPDANATSTATVKPRNGEILFARASTADGTDHHIHIWVMNPDGSNTHALSSGSYNDTEPVWSPDGTRIAFTSTRNGLPHIFVMNADGTGVTALTSGSALDVNPAWSPDGTRIAFTSTQGGRTHIYVVSAGGGTATALTSGSFFDATPAWSPDGSHIAFTSTRAGWVHIFVMKSDGTGAAPLTSGSFIDATPAWSPDGARIAFTSSRGGNTHIYTVLASGGAVTPLTSGAAFDALPAWSPDGSRIAFTSTRGGLLHIFGMMADGSAISAFTTGQSVDTSPSWRAAE